MKKIYLLILSLSISFLLNAQNLIVGYFDPNEEITITNTTVQYDTVYIINNGKLSVDNSAFYINNLLVNTDSGELSIKNSHLNANGTIIFYGNSTTILKDSLNLKCNITVGGNACLAIDSAIVDAEMYYVGQYNLIGVDSSEFHITNSVFSLSSGKYDVFFIDKSSFYQSNTKYNNSIGIAMTLGIGNNATLNIDDCSGGMELIISDSSNIWVNNTNLLVLWFSFLENAYANFELPAQNSQFPYASDVSEYYFSDSLSNVTNVYYNLELHNTDTVFWGIMQYSGSDITLNNSVVLACGFPFKGSVTDTVYDFFNDSLYSSYTAPLSDRNFSITNTLIQAWNFYPMDTSSITIRNCVFGELLSFNNSTAFVENSICDGTGGYFGAENNSKIYVNNSFIQRLYPGFSIILTSDSSEIFIQNSEIQGDVTLVNSSKIYCSNTVYNSVPIVNNSSYFLNTFVDSIPNAYIDSTVNLSGSIFDIKGISNNDIITGYKLEFSDTQTTNFLEIIDTNYTPYIQNSSIYNWNTSGISQGSYILHLTTYINGDSIITSQRNILLENISFINSEKNIHNGLINIFPNPTSGIFTIEGKDIQSIEITNISGQVLYYSYDDSKSSDEFRVDLRKYSKGVYFVKVQSKYNISTNKILLIE